MRLLTSPLLAATLLSCTPVQPEPIPAPRAAPASVHARFLVETDAADAAARLAPALDSSVPQLEEYFGEPVLRARNVQPIVHVYAQPSNTARPGLALAQSGTDDGKLSTYFAHIHLLGPTSDAKTSLGEPQDETYQHKTLVHEYASVMLDVLLRAKSDGWTYYRSPRWFYQGYPEYLAMHHSTPHARQTTRVLALEKALDRWDSPYTGGFARIEYLHERGGRDNAMLLLRSEEKDFWKAFERVYGFDAATLDERVKAWLAGR